MAWFTYILLCDQKTYYVGLTSNLQSRLKSHQLKQNIGTKEFSEIELVYHEQYETRKESEKREQQLKKWTVAKKKALITGDLVLLIRLSKTRSVLKDRKG